MLYALAVFLRISGFAIGIDLMAAQIVQSLKPSCPGMTLTAAIPFRGQADRFKPGDKMVYDGLMASGDEVIILSEYYYTRCFLDRNDFMPCAPPVTMTTLSLYSIFFICFSGETPSLS